MIRRFLRGAALVGFAPLAFVTSALAQSGEIRGQVTATGSPVAGISVQVSFHNGPFAGSALTDGSGDYAVAGLADGAYVVRAFSGSGLAGELYDNVNEFDYDLATPVTVAGGALVTGIDFALDAAASISGTITGLAAGQSAGVSVEDAFTRRYRGGTVSDPTFAYTIPNLRPGTYRMRANPWGTDRAIQYWNGKLRFTQADDVPVALGEAVAGKDFALVEGGSVMGTLTLVPPSADFTQIWVQVQDLATGEFVNSIQPNSSGAYLLPNVPAGSYALRVDTGGSGYVAEFYSSSQPDVTDLSQATPVMVTAGTSTGPIDLTLELGRTISGHVYLDANGNDVQDSGEPDVVDAQVNVNPVDGCCGNGTRTDASGHYTVGGLRAGLYHVNVQSTSADTPFVQENWNNKNFLQDQDAVDLTSGDATGIDFGVPPGDVISGIVFVDANGNGVRDPGEPTVEGNGQVRAADSSTGRCCTHTNIGADGRYALGVPPGHSYRVDASLYSGNLLREYWQNVFFLEDATPLTAPIADIDFSLVDGGLIGTLRGRVLDHLGSGVGGVDVSAERFATGSWVNGTRTGADGRFVIAGLPPGEYKLLFDTQSSNGLNDQDLVGEYWTRCQTSFCPPGTIDPNTMKVVFPAAPPPGDGPGADVGTFALSQGGSISGTVDVSGGGALPLPLNVRLQGFVSGGPFQPFLPGAAVAADGTYRIRGVPAPLAYKVQANTYGTDYVPVYYQTATTSTYDSVLAGAVDVGVGSETSGIDLHLVLGGSISGHVTCSVDGSDIVGFWMWADRSDYRFGAGATTDGSGRYTIRGLPPGDYIVRSDGRGTFSGACGTPTNITNPGLVPVTAGADTPGVDFVLAPGATVSGRVTQVVDGRVVPVVNIRVSASDYDTGNFASDNRTDADGYYSIPGLSSDHGYRILVETRDSGLDPQFFNFIAEYYDDKLFYNSATRVVPPNAAVDFQLAIGATLSGRVVLDGTNQPLSGINVCVNVYASGEWVNCDYTDQNGFYVLRGLPPASYRVSANPAPLNYTLEYYDNTTNWSAATPVMVPPVPPDGPVPVVGPINFSLSPGHSISGRLFYDANGNGVQDGPDEPGIAACPNVQTVDYELWFGTCADSNGDYTILGVLPGMYVAGINPGGTPYAAEFYKRIGGLPLGTTDRTQADLVDVTSGNATGIDLSLGLGGAVRGLVRDQDGGAPLPGINVRVSPAFSAGFDQWVTTDAAGAYLADGLAAGPYHVQARDDQNGVYVSEWHSNAFFRQQATAVTVNARTSPGDIATASVVDFDLSAGGFIEGDVYEDTNDNGVRDPGEAGIAFVNLTVSEFPSPNRCCFGSGTLQTDGDGHYRIGGLPPALSYRVQANAPQGTDFISVYYDGGDDRGTTNFSSAAPVSVSAGGTVSNLNFALARGGVMEGVVYHDANGNGIKDPGEPGLAGVSINIGTPNSCCFGQNRQTDADGHFAVRGIPGGSYRVQAIPPSNSDWVSVWYDGGNDQGTLNPSNVVLIPVVGGQTRSGIDFGLNLGGTLTGIVYDDRNDNGQQDAGELGVANLPMNVWVRRGTSDICCFGNGNRQTDSTGAFLMRGIPAAVAGTPVELRLQVNANPTNAPTDFISIYWDGGDDKGTPLLNNALPFFLSPGEGRGGLNFALTLGSAISGFLRDGNGSPISNFCCVNVQPLFPNASGRNSLTTTSTGEYVVRGLVPGLYRVDSGQPSGFTREFWDNQVDSTAADPVAVPTPASCGATPPLGCVRAGVDFLLTRRPQLVSGLTQRSGVQGTTVSGVSIGVSASSLVGGVCGTAPCARVEVGGPGVAVVGASLTGGVFTFNLQIAADAPLGSRALSIVNDSTLEDSALVIPNAFDVRAPEGAPPFDSPERLYVSDNELGQLRVYGATDHAPLARIDVCCDPGAVALSPDRRLAYLAGSSDRTLAVVDLAQGKEVFRTTALGAQGPRSIAVTARYIYVINREVPINNRINVFDALTWARVGHIVVGSNPFAMQLDPGGRRLWVTNQTSNTISIVDSDPVSPGVNTVLATVPLPAVNAAVRGVGFAPDLDGPGPLGPGARAYVVALQNTFVLDTSLVTGADPSLAYIDVDGDPATGFAVGTRTGISAIPTRGGGNGLIAMATIPGTSTIAAYVPESQQVRVIDLSTNPDRPRIVRTIAAGFFNPLGIGAATDGSRVFFAYNTTKDLWALDTAGILTSPAVGLTRVDFDRSGADPLLVGGLAVGARPTEPASRPTVTAVTPDGGTARSGEAFDATIEGSDFVVDAAQNLPVVWLRGTLVRGTILAGSSATSLRVSFPAHTPGGVHAVVVTNGLDGGNVSSAESVTLSVEAPAGYVPTQNVYVSSIGRNKVLAYQPASATPVEITVQPGPAGIVVTPDGRAALVSQLYTAPIGSPNFFWGAESNNLAVVDLDPSSSRFRQVVSQVPFVFSLFESPAATPDLADPDGVFVYAPNRGLSDTVSVLDPAACLDDPAACREIDTDTAPGTQTYPNAGDPFYDDLGSRLPPGLSRIALDSNISDFSKAPVEVATSPDGGTLYVANGGNGAGISVVRTSDGHVVGQYAFDGNRADGNVRGIFNVAVSPSGNRVYGIGLDSVPGPDGQFRPFAYAYDTGVLDDSESALVGCFAMPIDPLPGEPNPLKEIPRGFTIGADGRTAYTVSRLRGELWVLDLTTENLGCPSPAARVALPGPGVAAHAVAGNLLYIANGFRSEVYVYDITNRLSPTLVTTLPAPCANDVAIQPAFGGPRLAGVFPTAGPPAGGTPVTLNGANFTVGGSMLCRDGRTFPVCVEFGDEVASDIVVDNSFTIHATTPPGVNGPATVRVTNPDGRFSELSGRFRYQSDLTPPVFNTPPYVASQTLVGCPACTVTAEIRWETDEESDSRVDYGATAALGLTASSPALVTGHSVLLAGLDPGAVYHWRVTSRDSSGNARSSPTAPATVSFTTVAAPDTTPPVITGVPAVFPTDDAASVYWTTNEESTSEVDYDDVLDGNPTLAAAGAVGATHAVTIGGLAPDTRYEYRVRSRDASSNAVVSAVGEFRTSPSPDRTPPVVLSGPGLSYLTNNLVIVTWTTDEPSTSFINYGISTVDEQGVIDVTLTTRHIVFLTNLLPGTAYGYQFGSTDASGNTILSADPLRQSGPSAPGTQQITQTMRVGVATLRAGTMLATASATSGFTTAATEDTTPPALTTAVTITPLSFDRVLVTSATDEGASILARYGLATLGSSAFDPTFAQAQGLVLAGLEAGRTYSLEVVLTDPKGNARTVSGLSFTTPTAPDTAAPVITSLVAAPSQTSALVTWTTDEPASAAVHFGVAGGPLRSATSLEFGTSHAVPLTGLVPGATYSFQAVSRDASGNEGSAAGTPFVTAFVAPDITSITPSQAAQGASATVTLNGSGFDSDAHVDAGAGVDVTAVSVSPHGTQVLVALSVSATAPVGPRSITLTNPRSGLSASEPFRIADTTVPQVHITEPVNGSELTSPTVVVRGTVSESSVLTVNGEAAAVAPDLTFTATLHLGDSGPHRLAAVATDPSGNRGTSFVDVTLALLDTTPPSLVLAATPAQLWPADHTMVPVTIGVTVQDDTDPAPAVVLVSAESSEPDDAPGPGDGSTVGDIQDAQSGTDDRQVQLRAERARTGPGRVYTLRYRATDQSGNSAEKTVEVRVPHDPGADLSVTGTAHPPTVLEGGVLEYAFTVTNNGPLTATGVVLTDDLPGGVTVRSASFACRGTDLVTCKLGILPSGRSASVKIVVSPTTVGILQNTATVSTSASDPQLANNSATVSVEVTSLQPLRQQIGALVAEVASLVADQSLKARQGQALTQLLHAADDALGERDLRAALNKMEAFVARVELYVRLGALTPAQAAPLLDGGNAIVEALELALHPV